MLDREMKNGTNLLEKYVYLMQAIRHVPVRSMLDLVTKIGKYVSLMQSNPPHARPMHTLICDPHKVLCPLSSMDMTDIEILNPVSQGSWLAIPISPEISITSPALQVVQNNLANELPSPTAWIVRNLIVGICNDMASSKFLDNINMLENFIKVGVTSLWPMWYFTMFKKSFLSSVRVTAHPNYQSEMRLNVLMNNATELVIVDENERALMPRDIAIGSVIIVDMTVSGMWCSTDRCGLRYTIKKITVCNRIGQEAMCLLE